MKKSLLNMKLVLCSRESIRFWRSCKPHYKVL